MSEKEPYEIKYHVADVCEVVHAELLTPRVRRITLHSTALKGLDHHWRPEMLIRLYFPPKEESNPPEPFITSDGELKFKTTSKTEVSPFSAVSEDPLVRAYTARQFRADELELDIDFVLHEAPGIASDWARQAKTGDRIGVVEFALPPGHRPAVDYEADVYLLFADEAAISSAQTNLEAFAPGTRVIAFFEVADKLEEQKINTKTDLKLTWLHRGDAEAGTSGLLFKAIKELDWPEGKVFVWACGEMKMVTMIRKFIMEEHGLQKGSFKCQAYWRRGRTEVERMKRMTELSLAAAESNPEAFQESFENIGMNIEDPTLFNEPEEVEVTEADHSINNADLDEINLAKGYDIWDISMQTPLGKQKAILYLSIDDKKITGKMDSNVGSSEIIDGKIEGDTLKWEAEIKLPRSVTFKFSAKIKGDIISGKVKLGILGGASLKGTRRMNPMKN